MTYTYTYVVMEISQAAYDEIKKKMKEADYNHVFHKDSQFGPVIDMHGIAVAAKGDDNGNESESR